jgi:cytochrome c553
MRSGGHGWRGVVVVLLASTAACGSGVGGTTEDARMRELEARFTPGLHSMMTDLATRHASLWFAGAAENWALADYMVHELEEVTEHIEEVHPVYGDIQVAALLREMTLPAMEELEAAVAAGDRDGFTAAYDRLTTACNHCHEAGGRSAIVIQRPTTPPLTNLRYAPRAPD